MYENLTNYYRIEKAIGFLTTNFRKQPDLDEISRKVSLSPFHFHRIFKDWVGISPKQFVQYLTIDFLRHKIRETSNMMEAAELAGMSSQSRLHDLFVRVEGMSPQEFKSAGKGLKIYFGYHPTPFGLCFIAVAERGICALKFIDEEKSRNEWEIFSRQWNMATIIHDPNFTQEYIAKIFGSKASGPRNLQVLVKGTEFQIRVWEALVKIPFGSVGSFQQVANMIGQPNAARSVGSAVGSNSILYLIPCHRIISEDGTMGNYHFGKARKQTMIGWEMTKVNDGIR